MTERLVNVHHSKLFYMNNSSGHTFHIPVMGLGYTIDTPVKVARFGISSVISIIQDHLIEQIRAFHCHKSGEEYIPISSRDIDHRAKRITAYLNLVQRIVNKQMEELKTLPFEEGNELDKYFHLLPDSAPLKRLYLQMTRSVGHQKEIMQNELRKLICPGSIDVNIMTKLNNSNYTAEGEMLPMEYDDAVSALRGYAKSNLMSSIIFSAGLNPRLYSFLEEFPDFYPDSNGHIKKNIILKVSDFRSAFIQGKFLAKKGLWVSEFRVESGLNCGGHAFPTQGYLLGPILEEFKLRKEALQTEMHDLYSNALISKKNHHPSKQKQIRITVQGGIGTFKEDQFLRNYYNLDGTGWGSPFLLVPEVTNVDKETLLALSQAKQEDYFLSDASPLETPFNNFRKSSSETQRKNRIAKNRAGSPCYLKFLSSNTEFTKQPICVSSREYQEKKLKQLGKRDLTKEEYSEEFEKITGKDCLCEGLSVSVLLQNHIPDPHKLKAVNICPGPNLAYFSKISSLKEMVGHIYGKQNLSNSVYRPHVFVNELKMYADYLRDQMQKCSRNVSNKQLTYFNAFQTNLIDGISYYKTLINRMGLEWDDKMAKMQEQLEALKSSILEMEFSSPIVAS